MNDENENNWTLQSPTWVKIGAETEHNLPVCF